MAGNRKFILAMYFGTAIFALCYVGRVTSGDCIIAVTVLAGLFKAANVLDKRLGGAG